MQKPIYFFKIKIQDLNSFNYVYDFYGSFSSDVSIALFDMLEFSFIIQNMHSGYQDNTEYYLTENGIKYAENAKKNYPIEYDIIKNIMNVCEKYCKLKPLPLSFAARTHYIKTNHRDYFDQNDTPKKPAELGWNMSETDVERGITLLKFDCDFYIN